MNLAQHLHAALCTLLGGVVPLHLGLLAIGLRLRRVYGKRWCRKTNRKARGNDHRNKVFHCDTLLH
jgi:hypothetical protein